MADAAIGVVTEAVLKTVASLAAEEISLAWGVEEQLKQLVGKLKMIQALLSGAQSKQITVPAVQLWLKKLQSISLYAQIVLDEFGYEVLRQKIEKRKRDKLSAIFSSSNPLSFRPKMAHKIKDVLTSLEDVYAEANQIGLRPLELIESLHNLKEIRSTVPFVEDSEIMGREDDVENVIAMLTNADYERDLPVIAILGMGGQGKTTLAQLVYKSDKVESYFEKTIWVCVSNDFNVKRLLAEMQSPTGTNYQSATEVDLVNKLKQQLGGKKYLLVLDDVWNDNGDEWEQMRTCLLEIGGSQGSKILATMRSENVASAMRTSRHHRLGTLSEGQSRELFERCAFADGGATKTPQMVDIGKRLLKRCGGVPLAIKAIGGLLYSKNSESEWLMIESSETWSTSKEGNRVLAAIELSYDYLPSLSIKQCFAYCAIFEKDTVLKKDQLIQLWMAQGLLHPPQESRLQMEDVGGIYFNILLRNSLFQDPKMDDDNNIAACKMHDLVHDVALKVSKNYCYHLKDWKGITNEIEAVHISISSGERGMWKSLKSVLPSNLRTLHLKDLDLSEDLFENFKCLSVLIVDNWDVEELPNSIGKMQHLRFLDISRTHIERIPKSFTKLYYLQTLRVDSLKEVPKGFGKLINLRHIDMDKYSDFLFPELGQLINLQTLFPFNVGRGHGYPIEELEHLDNLRGTLKIYCLRNVGSYETAAKAKLLNKPNIQTLELHWGGNPVEKARDGIDVMEGLKPHSNLKSLTINYYQSPKFPSWMVGKNDSPLLHNLMKVTLSNLYKCERLPSLGLLPFLEDLQIELLPDVKCIGKEFYGWSNLESSSGSNNGSEITLFPALKILKLRYMRSVVEWSDAIENIPKTNSSSPVQVLKVFPHLEEMYITDLPNLSVFPNLGSLPSLRLLIVEDCENLTTMSMSYGDWNRELGSSQKLEIDDEIERHSSHIQYYFPSLRHLKIVIASFCSLISSLTTLESLTIHCNPSSWPKDLHHLIRLRELSLGGGRRDSEQVTLDSLPWPYPTCISNALSHSISLTSLSLAGWECPKVTSLPHQIQYVTTLTYLEIDGFDGLEVLPEWLSNLKCLGHFKILYCKNVKQLPSTEAFQRLTNLQILEIKDCPFLEMRCRRESGSEWPKIAHIPHLEI